LIDLFYYFSVIIVISSEVFLSIPCLNKFKNISFLSLNFLKEFVELIEVRIRIEFPSNIMSSFRNLKLDFKLSIDGRSDEFCHLMRGYYFVLEGADKEDGLPSQYDAGCRWPVIALEVGEGRQKGHECRDHILDAGKGVLEH
jgi:hypothetical protein